MPDLAQLVPELQRIALEAGRMAQASRQQGHMELKADGSIVTNGDREVETFLRGVLPALVPGTTVWGEEEGLEAEGPGGLWCVDPIDGTSNFAFGSPLWGVSIGLIKGEEPLLGAIYLPDLGELLLGARGLGATLNGAPIAGVPEGPVQPHHLVSYCDHVLRFIPSNDITGKMRCSGAFVIDGAFTILQRYRGLIGIRERLYDAAATLVLAGEVGLEVRYADGSPFLLEPLKDNRPIPKPWLVYPKGSGFIYPSS